MNPPGDLFGRLARVVGDSRGQEVGRVAVQAGLITPDQLRDCEAEAARRPGEPFRRILEARVGVSPQALDVLETLLKENDPSRLLAGRYEMRGELGRGAMGVIRRAWDLQLRRHVAIKFLRSDAKPSPELLRRVKQEAMAVARLNHPHIPVLHDVGEAGGLPYLVMELIEGPSLAERIAKGPMGVREAAALMEKVARAIHHAHAHGVVHRDIKPDNIRLDPAGEPHILDFGLVHLHGAGEALTRTGAAVGTPYYMAPEQVRGEKGRIDPRTDVYGLGATLYEAATGRPPFAGATLAEVFDRVLSSEPEAPSRVRAGLPPELSHIILKAMAKEPDRRYPTALELAEDLRRHLAGEPVRAHPSSITFRFWKRIRRRPRAWLIGGIAGGLVVAAAVVAAAYHGRSKESETRLDAATRLHRAATAYHELSLATLIPMQELEARWHSGLAGPEGEARLKQVEAAVDEVAARFPESHLPGAWKGLARMFAGHEEGLAQIEATCRNAGEDPFPPALLARAQIARYSGELSLPSHTLTSTRLIPEPLQETQVMLDARSRVIEALGPVVRHPAWAGLRQGRELQAFARAVEHLGRGAYPEASATLAALMEDPALRDSAGWLLGIARFMAGDHAGAADVFEATGRQGWCRAFMAAATTRSVLAMKDSLEKRDPVPNLERAVGLGGDAIRLNPNWAPAFNAMGTARMKLAGVKLKHDPEEGRAEFTRAIEAFTKALDLDPGDRKARTNRSQTRIQLASAMDRTDPETWRLFAQATKDAEQVVREHPEFDPGHLALANALTFQTLQRPGPDPEKPDRLQRAISEFLKVVDRRPEDLQVYLGLALAREQLGDYPAALEAIDRLIHLDASPEFLRRRAAILQKMGKDPEKAY